MKRILSCMQPTSHLHLGNYLGALKNWVSLQNEGAECLYGVVDLHAITLDYDKDALAQSTREIAAAYIAAGIDPAQSAVFVQSAVPAHSELMWLFATMAADILVYKATHVPVGEDQKQHLELAREIAATFNTRYGEDFFPQPEPVITGPAPRVMSLRNGSEKMSKSAPSDMTRINLTDDADLIAKKIRKAKSDSDALPSEEAGLEGRAEARNLVTLYAALSDRSIADVLREFGGQEFSKFKPAFIDVAVDHLAPITSRMSDLLANPDEIDRVLAQGNAKANDIAAPILSDVQRLMGFWK